MEEVMKVTVTGISRIAAAVSLALGSGLALAQERQDPFADEESAIEQRSAEQRPDANADASAQRSEQEADSRSAVDQGGFEEVAEQNPDLSKFVEAVNASGLADALTSGSDYTIFAPTNEALDGEDIDSLIDQESSEELVALLRAHIVADDVDREMAGRIGQAQTIDGGVVDISVEEDKLMVGDAEAVDEEIQIGNLRVYAVDSVLPSNPLPQTASNTAPRSGADSRSGLGDLSGSAEAPDSETRLQ
jgi:uncharacterized surface protein with fasciclin (FAS1) repeats